MNVRELVKSKPLIRIVPVEHDGSCEVGTQGTEVFVGDQRITGITQLEIFAVGDDFWRARISCAIYPPNITAIGSFTKQRLIGYERNLWKRFLVWLCELTFKKDYIEQQQ